MNVKININRRAMEALKNQAVDVTQQRYQPILDGLLTEFKGVPVADIKPVLAKRWAAGNDGASITDPELTSVAQAISDGIRVEMIDGRLSHS